MEIDFENIPENIKKELEGNNLYMTQTPCPNCNYSGIFAVIDMYTPWYFFLFPWFAGWIEGMGLKHPILKCPNCLLTIKT